MITLKQILKRFGLKLTADGKVVRVNYPTDPILKARQILSHELTQSVDWKHGDIDLQNLNESRYYRLWSKHKGGHKKYSYFSLYDLLFSSYVGKKPRVLEIGVYKGASIHTWREFFGEGSVVVGIDINPDCTQCEDKEKNVFVRIGSQTDGEFLKKVTAEFGPFDIIIDDGSHRTDHIISTFNHTFLHGLAECGLYFIEDLNTSYWPECRTSKFSAMDLVLCLAELTHHFYIDNRYDDYVLNKYKGVYLSPLVSTLVNEVRVFDSAAAIYKKPHYPPLVFHT